MALSIERLPTPPSDADLRALAQLLHDTVHAGDSVSFVLPFSVDDAAAWWQRTFADAPAGAVWIVARSAGELVGTVQLQPAWAPNQRHRAEVCKLLVHARHRRQGLGQRLMLALEDAARSGGYTLLTLDTRRGSAAEHLYPRLGYTRVGVIPSFAVDPDGVTPHDTVVFYKRL